MRKNCYGKRKVCPSVREDVLCGIVRNTNSFLLFSQPTSSATLSLTYRVIEYHDACNRILGSRKDLIELGNHMDKKICLVSFLQWTTNRALKI